MGTPGWGPQTRHYFRLALAVHQPADLTEGGPPPTRSLQRFLPALGTAKQGESELPALPAVWPWKSALVSLNARGPLWNDHTWHAIMIAGQAAADCVLQTLWLWFLTARLPSSILQVPQHRAGNTLRDVLVTTRVPDLEQQCEF